MTKITREKAREALVGMGFENPDLLLDLIAPKQTTNEGVNDWIRSQAARGVHRITTGLPVAATTPAATTPTANAGNTGAPDVRESTSKQMGRIIRQATGRKG